MILDYIGVKEINGSLIVLDGVKDASFEEIVDIRLDDGSLRQGRIVQMEGDRVVVQVFEGTRGISLANTRTRLMGHPMELALSPEILGRVFDGAGRPIDGLGDVFPVMRRNINGTPINPVSRVYPKNYINTGISTIDTLMTLIRGQKLPIFTMSSPCRSPVRRASPARTAATPNSRLCSRPWASRTTLRSISAARSMNPAYCKGL